MTNKKLAILGAVAVVMVVLAIFSSSVKQYEPPKSEGPTYLLQGFDPEIVSQIYIKGSGSEVTLTRTGDVFTISDKDNYPARISKINDMITKVLDIKYTSKYTSNPDNFGELGVTEDKARYVVRFMDNEGELITGVLIGESKGQGGGSYVRRAESNDVMVSMDNAYISTRPIDYMEQELVSTEQSKIELVKVSGPGFDYTLSKNEANNVTVDQAIPEGKQLMDSDASSVFNAVSSLRFDDVKKADGGGDLKFEYKYFAQLEDSTEYSIDAAKNDDEVWVKVSAEFTDQTPVMKEQGVESDEQLKKKEAKLLAMEAVSKLNKQADGWIFKIPSWQGDKLVKSFDDLIEDIEEPEDSEEAEVNGTN